MLEPPAGMRLPARRSDLIVQSIGEAGQCVIKDPRAGDYFRLEGEEAFLFQLLDGQHALEDARSGYRSRFAEDLCDESIQQFLDVIRDAGLLAAPTPHLPDGTRSLADGAGVCGGVRLAAPLPSVEEPQSILSWRRSLFDPDRLLSRIEPILRFFWTPAFALASAVLVVTAISVVAATSAAELVSHFNRAMRWETLLAAWIMLIVLTTLHEFAHGLTCKHFGGDVHEIGFLLLFFIPCFYCNVSDAWLFREKSKRLLVTFAGAHCDLVLWAGAVVLWRVTVEHSLVNYLAWVALSICGARIFFNLNPLLKLDGYYLLSDLLELPNLRQRAWDRWTHHVRRLLWGAPGPQPEQSSRFLTLFGLASWLYSALFLAVMVWGCLYLWGRRWGMFGAAGAAIFGYVLLRGMFSGFSAGQVGEMIKRRQVRIVGWLVVVGALAALAVMVPMDYQSEGNFRLRPAKRAEVFSPAEGFLREITCDEGDSVQARSQLFCIEVPDLASQIARKRADLRSAILRPEQETNRARLAEELKYMEQLQARCRALSPIDGIIVTPHLREKQNAWLHEGEPVCTIEDVSSLEAEVELDEMYIAQTKIGQTVQLKARSLPFQEFRGVVTRIAPAVAKGDGHNIVRVYCRVDHPPPLLKPGMSGHARIVTDRASVARVMFMRVMRFVRTEFW